MLPPNYSLKNHIYNIHKHSLALNNPQGIIYYKIQPNQSKTDKTNFQSLHFFTKYLSFEITYSVSNNSVFDHISLVFYSPNPKGVELSYLPNPSARAGYDTRSIFLSGALQV